MADGIRVSSFADAERGGLNVSAHVDPLALLDSGANVILARVVELVAQHIAAEFVERHGVEIAERLSPEAVANLTIAAAGAQINETLNKKLPDKIMHVVETRTEREVYQRGVLGGLKRIR